VEIFLSGFKLKKRERKAERCQSLDFPNCSCLVRNVKKITSVIALLETILTEIIENGEAFKQN
jgi:hypothetical protein